MSKTAHLIHILTFLHRPFREHTNHDPGVRAASRAPAERKSPLLHRLPSYITHTIAPYIGLTSSL